MFLSLGGNLRRQKDDREIEMLQTSKKYPEDVEM